jgi:comEA protein
MIIMTNYYQKILLLCILLLGCVLTSIGVECFEEADEQIPLPPSTFIQSKANSKESTNDKKQTNLFSEQLSLDENTFQFSEKIHNQNINNNQIKTKSKAQVKQSIQPSESSQKLQTVNINTATEAELDTLPGIGPAIAKRIIAFRNQQAFSKPEDIMLVKGIGKKKFAKLRERITVE